MKKNYFVIIFLILLLTPFASLNAVSSDSVYYDIDRIIMDVRLDYSGNVTVKEAIVQSGTYNGYIRDLVWAKDYNNSSFENLSDFESNSIYNASGITINSVGIIEHYSKFDFSIFDNNIVTSNLVDNATVGDRNVYSLTKDNNMYSLKMFNETISDRTVYYIEYVLHDVAILHNDCAEIYYNFIGDGFDDEIGNVQIRVLLPDGTTGDVRVWAQGQINGEIERISGTVADNNIYYGASLSVDMLQSNSPVTFRMLYPKDLLTSAVKISGVDAFNQVIQVEQNRADKANALRKKQKSLFYVVQVLSSSYIIGLIFLCFRVYNKYDKEFTSNFNSEYNREFIDDYDVEIVEYLMNKNVSENAFSASILNLIYKKNIEVEKLNDKKDNYILRLKNEDGISKNEGKIIKLLFSDIGNGKEVTLKEIKDYAKKVSASGNSRYYNSFVSWKNSVDNTAQNENFYINNTSTKLKLSLYALLGIILFIVQINVNSKYVDAGFFSVFLAIATLISTVVYTVYLIVFRKRTERGNDHFRKWSAFKKFLEDFGRFDEKELPEIALWERYLVYATVFGIADKVQKTMKIKLSSMGVDTEHPTGMLYDYMMFDSISHGVRKSMSDSVRTAHNAVMSAQSKAASGSGFGGGFSSGGGFGGGGGGGRGF